MTPRRYIRHPSEIPITIQASEQARDTTLRDIGLGGLCIQTQGCLPHHVEITIRIPLLTPSFEARGRVAWCRHLGPDRALLGIRFSDPETAFAVRMIEQVFHIESYRRRASEASGRELSSQEAAQEWISLYASRFPQ